MWETDEIELPGGIRVTPKYGIPEWANPASREFTIQSHDDKPKARRPLTPKSAESQLRFLFRTFGTDGWSVEVPTGAWEVLENVKKYLSQERIVEIQEEERARANAAPVPAKTEL